jgi:hypothetical protein
MQMFHHMFESVAKTQLQVQEVTETVHAIQDTFLQRDPDWRKHINRLLKGAAHRSGGDYSATTNESYRLLEERGACDLAKRLRNLKQRLEDSGATKTAVKEANRLDVIESDKRLKEIYTTVVKELSIGTLRLVK